MVREEKERERRGRVEVDGSVRAADAPMIPSPVRSPFKLRFNFRDVV